MFPDALFKRAKVRRFLRVSGGVSIIQAIFTIIALFSPRERRCFFVF